MMILPPIAARGYSTLGKLEDLEVARCESQPTGITCHALAPASRELTR
jgi:hypothetical protein